MHIFQIFRNYSVALEYIIWYDQYFRWLWYKIPVILEMWVYALLDLNLGILILCSHGVITTAIRTLATMLQDTILFSSSYHIFYIYQKIPNLFTILWYYQNISQICRDILYVLLILPSTTYKSTIYLSHVDMISHIPPFQINYPLQYLSTISYS